MVLTFSHVWNAVCAIPRIHDSRAQVGGLWLDASRGRQTCRGAPWGGFDADVSDAARLVRILLDPPS